MTIISEEPLDLLFDKYFSLLVLYAKRFVSSYAISEDIVQETFLHLWEKESSRQYSKAYLFACVHNRAINFIKRTKVSVEIKENHFFSSSNYLESPQYSEASQIEINEQVLEEFERLRALFRALEKLPPKTLEVLNSVYLEGKLYSVVAQEMELSLNTVKAHMYMALKLLRKYLLVFWVF